MGSYLAHGPEIYPKAHKNPRAFSCIFGPFYLGSSIQCPCGVGLHHLLSFSFTHIILPSHSQAFPPHALLSRVNLAGSHHHAQPPCTAIDFPETGEHYRQTTAVCFSPHFLPPASVATPATTTTSPLQPSSGRKSSQGICRSGHDIVVWRELLFFGIVVFKGECLGSPVGFYRSNIFLLSFLFLFHFMWIACIRQSEDLSWE